MTALRFLRDGAKILPGENVLVIGASGAVGSAAVQLARYFGAHVTAVCSAANTDLVASIGADRVIDSASGSPLNDQYDIIFDAVGATSFAQCEHALKPDGRLLLIAGALAQVLGAGAKSKGKRVLAGPGQEKIEHILLLKQLAETGAFKPVIDQCLPLNEIVKAHRRVDTGRKRGSVVILVSSEAEG